MVSSLQLGQDFKGNGCHGKAKDQTRPITSENRCKLYQPERKLTKAILTLLNLEGEAQGEI